MATNNAVNVGLSGTTGTGSFVGSVSPTLVTPSLLASTGTSLSLSGGITVGTTTGGITVGLSSTTTGITLNNNTASYTPSVLNFVQSTTGSVAATNGWTTNPGNFTFSISRVEKITTMTFNNFGNFRPSSSASINFAAGSIPARFAPQLTLICYTSYNNGGGLVQGSTEIKADGSFKLYSDTNLGGFLNSIDYFQYGCSFSWVVA